MRKVSKAARGQSTALGLNAWTELVGVVKETGANYVIIECSRRYRINLDREILRSNSTTLRKGVKVALLALDDSSIRIRSVALSKPLTGSGG